MNLKFPAWRQTGKTGICNICRFTVAVGTAGQTAVVMKRENEKINYLLPTRMVQAGFTNKITIIIKRKQNV